MADRNPRRTAAIIAVTVIVLVAVGIGFYSLARRSATPGTTPTPATSTAVSPTPTYAPTDPNGSPEPGLAMGDAIAGKGGVTTGPAGLPLGYPHDRTGAVDAATNYLIWMNSLKITDKTTADAMAAATAADQITQHAMIASFDDLRTGMHDLTADRPEPRRGAYAVASYDDTSAEIYVWAPEVTTGKDGNTDHVWAIDGVRLRWTANDWKLDGGLISKAGGAAVDPVDPAGNPSAEEKHSILRRTPADPGQITDSADQTWFEYANAPH